MSPLAALHLAGLLARNGEQQAAEKLIDLRLNANFNRTTIAALLALEAQIGPPSLRTNIGAWHHRFLAVGAGPVRATDTCRPAAACAVP